MIIFWILSRPLVGLGEVDIFIELVLTASLQHSRLVYVLNGSLALEQLPAWPTFNSQVCQII